MFIQLCKTFEQAKIEEIQLQSLRTSSMERASEKQTSSFTHSHAECDGVSANRIGKEKSRIYNKGNAKLIFYLGILFLHVALLWMHTAAQLFQLESFSLCSQTCSEYKRVIYLWQFVSQVFSSENKQKSLFSPFFLI